MHAIATSARCAADPCLNNDTEIVYDAFDRTIRVNDAENHYRTTAYDKNGNVTLVRAYKSDNTKLTETTLAYDDDNLMTSQSQWAKKADLSTNIGSGAIVSTLEYDTSGLLVTKADPCGCGGSGTTVMLYDAAGRLVTVKDHSPTTYQTDLLLDAYGRTTQIEQDEIDGGTTRTYVVKRTYNADGHLTKIEEKGGGGATALTTNLLVDARGRVRKVTDPNGNETYFKMDDFGRVVQTDQMLTVSTEIEMRVVYDLNNNVLQKILERGATDGVVEYVYDNADRLVTSKDEGATHHATYIYDAASNVSRFTDRNGSVVTCSYDKLNQMTLQSASLGSGVVGPTTTKYYYDALGRSISAFNGDAKVSRTFNTLSRLESETTWVTPASEASPGISSKTISYDYDGDGKLSLTHYPDSTTVVKRTYDTLGRVTKIERKRGGGSFNTVATWAFQGPSKMKTLEWGNRTKETMVYDAYGRATLMTHERQTGASTWVDMYDYERGYDAASRPTFERREYRKSSDGNLLTGRRDFGDLFAYDAVNRITAVVEGVGYQTTSHTAVTSASLTTIDFVNRAEYTFDEAGNRQTLLRYDSNGTVSKQSQREDHTFDIENQLGTRKEWFYDSGTSGLTLRNTITYTHDNAGSQTSSSGGGIGAVSVDLAGRIYEAGDWVYRYDPFGRRVEKRDTQGGGFHRWYFYDGVTCVEEYEPCEGHGDIDICSTPDPIWQRVYGPYLTDQILWGEYDADGDRTTTNTPMFFHLDFIGSVVMVTDDTGSSSYPTILESYRYDSYGTPTFLDGNGGARSSSAYEQDKLYTGRRFDPELGTYYYRARTMSSSTGAFLSRDPIWTWGSLYSYVGNRPIDRIDPMGEQPGIAVVQNLIQNAPQMAQQAAAAAAATALALAAASDAAGDAARAAAGAVVTGAEMLWRDIFGGRAKPKPAPLPIPPRPDPGQERIDALIGTMLAVIAGQVSLEVLKAQAADKPGEPVPPAGGSTQPEKESEGKVEESAVGSSVHTRAEPGADGGVSTITIKRDSKGRAISRTHTVTKDGQVIHQHEEHIGAAEGERRFPDEWTGTQTINAPEHTPKPPNPAAGGRR